MGIIWAIPGILASIFQEMPIVYLLVFVIIALIAWLIIEYLKNKRQSFSSVNRNGIFHIDVIKQLPFVSVFYDLQYQMSDCNSTCKSHFEEKGIFTKVQSTPLDQMFYNKELLNYLDSLIFNESPQTFEVEVNLAKGKLHYFATIMMVGGKGFVKRQIAVILQNIEDKPERSSRQPEIDFELRRNYKKLTEQAKQYEEQINELEKAFKHSSKHHIQLQKALLENERQRKQLQEAVEVINKQKNELKKANDEIKHHARMKEIFFANTSHEIRTPLNAIIGFTNLLMQLSPNDRQLEYLRNIKASGDNLLIVLNDILDFSKIEAGKMTFENISFLLTEQMNYLVSTLNVKAKEKRINLALYLDPELPEVLIGDPTRLNQILMNLIGNSIKFTNEEGKVILRVQQSTRNEKIVKLKFEVEDNGIGIAKEKIGTIFNSFTQAENETTRKFGGTGLGLAIVKQLVELQDGEIFVKSETGKGSIFTFYLSFAIGTFRSIKKKQAAQIEIKSAKDIRLLLAEDNKINQHLAIDTIRNWQKEIQIDVAENGSEACEMVEKNEYHLVFMDVQMPEMDGIEATKYIRANLPVEKRNIPIIAMTAHALKNEREHFIEVGMDDYLSKPFAPETLIQKISYYSSPEIQEQVKQGKKIAVINQDEIEKNRYELKSYTPESNDIIFEHIDLSYLKKIYQGDYKRIKKILKMYVETVGNEIDEIYNAYFNENFEIVRAKSHALKPKMNYLGCKEMFENSKHIEQTLKQDGDPKQLKDNVEYIKSAWPEIENEIKSFLNN